MVTSDVDSEVIVAFVTSLFRSLSVLSKNITSRACISFDRNVQVSAPLTERLFALAFKGAWFNSFPSLINTYQITAVCLVDDESTSMTGSMVVIVRVEAVRVFVPFASVVDSILWDIALYITSVV